MTLTSKTWLALKHYTDALEAYNSYTLTGNKSDLEITRRSCIRAVYSERNYKKAVDMLIALGYIYIKTKNFRQAQKIFHHVSKFQPDRGAFGFGVTFGLQGEYSDALRANNEALKANSR